MSGEHGEIGPMPLYDMRNAIVSIQRYCTGIRYRPAEKGGTGIRVLPKGMLLKIVS